MSVDGDAPLPLQLVTDQDNADAIAIKARLEALVSGSVTPPQAAVAFDAWVVSEAEHRLGLFKTRSGPDRYEPTTDEVARGIDSVRSIGPNPQGHISDLFEGIAKLCSSFPPFHATQDVVIHFIKALDALPARHVPNVTPAWRLYDGNTGELRTLDHPGWDTMELWAFRDPEGDLAGLVKDSFRNEAEATYSYEYSDVETLGSEVRLRWRNFQSFAARLTAAGLADCTYICALRDILPSSRQYPDVAAAARKVGGPNRIGGDAVAGAQWLLSPDEGRWAYRRCRTGGEDPWGIWGLAGWEGWKEQFAWIGRDERFDAESQVVARLARREMERYEAEL